MYLGSPAAISYGPEAADRLHGELVGWFYRTTAEFPARGFFFFSPFFLLGLGELVQAIKRPTSLGFFVIVACIVFVAVMSAWWSWYGGISHGNRMLTDILPLIGLLLAKSSVQWSGVRWTLFTIAAAYAIVAHAVGIFDYGACWHRFYDTPEGWDKWIWSLPDSPIPFYLERFSQGQFQCWST